MSAPIILSLAITRHQVGVVVLTLERLERHDIFGLDMENGQDRISTKLGAIISAHAPTRVVLTSPHPILNTAIVTRIRDLLGPRLHEVVEHRELVRRAKLASRPTTNRARARAYADQYPSLHSRVPKIPPLRSVRTPFERHHEVLFRATLLADLTLIDSLTPELPLYDQVPSPHAARP